MAGKFQRDSKGYYTAYIPTGEYYEDGTNKYKVIRSKDKSKLEGKIEQYKKKSLLNITDTKITLNQLYEIWITSYKSNCSQNTISFYKTMYSVHIQPVLGSMRVTDIREMHCQGLLNKLGNDGKAEKTIKNIHSVLYSLLDVAERNRYIAYNPAAHLQAKGRKQEQRRALTEEERERFLLTCKTNQYGMFGAFLYWFGLRRGECLALKKCDIGDSEITISRQHIFPDKNQPLESTTKTEAGVRTIPIPDKAREYIDFDSLPDGYLFTDQNGKPWSYKVYQRVWKQLSNEAFGSDSEITPHYLRHNYATMLCEVDIPMMAAKSYCGHADIETTMKIYQHYTQTLADKAESKMKDFGK